MLTEEKGLVLKVNGCRTTEKQHAKLLGLTVNVRRFSMDTDSEISRSGNSRKRLTTELRVYYGPSQKMLLYSFSVDIGSGGLFLKTETPFSIDDKLLLSFTLPEDSNPISCRAKVAWINLLENPRKPDLPQGIGIKFTGLSEESLRSIQTLLKYVEIEPVC